MVVNHKINMDLAGSASMPRVDMVQKDQYTRQLELTLYSGGTPWVIPEDATAVICFLRPDGTGGDYDVLGDGTKAWAFSENVLTVQIAPAVLNQAGPVLLAVNLLVEDSRISTFAIMLNVQAAVAAGSGVGEEFTVTAYLPLPAGAEAGQYLRVAEVSENGLVLRLETEEIPDFQTVVEEMLAAAESITAQSVHVTRELITDRNITVNFKKNRLQGVSAPKEDTDAANKAYVDQVHDPYYVPDYWQEAVTEAAEKVTAYQDAGGKDCLSFAWFSDCHIAPDSATPNPGYTGKLAGAVMEECHIPFALLTGDAARADGNDLASEAEMRESLKAADAVLKPIGWDRLLQVQGNHDGSWGMDDALADPYYCYQMDGKELYGAVYRKQAGDSRRVFGGDGSYFYVDDPNAKVRFILLNSHWVEDGTGVDGAALHRRMRTFGYGNTQLNWLADTALSFGEEGWAVVLAAHVPPVSAYDATARDAAVLRNILNAFSQGGAYNGSSGTEGAWDYVCVDCDFSGKPSAELVGFFCGHAHKDQILTGELPCAVVTITSDADLSYDDTEETRVMGTDTEHAMDFVTINRETGKVQLTRLGVGEDREFTYSTKAESGENTNFADPDSADWANDSRLNGSFEVVESEGSCVTNWIGAGWGDVIRVKGLDITNASSGYVVWTRTDMESVDGAKSASYPDCFTLEGEVVTLTVLDICTEMEEYWAGKIRFSGTLMDGYEAEDVVITVNQEI